MVTNQKAETRNQKRGARARWAWRLFLVSGFWFLVFPAFANELTVDSRRVQRNDLVTVTVTLEDAFTKLDELTVPMKNLAIFGEPWVSSEFAWINGRVIQRKSFRYRARPLAAGPARVGPLVLNVDDEKVTLPAIDLEILPDRASGSNDAETVLRELAATERDLVFVVAEADRKEVFAGEPVTITWFLYNAASIQQWQIVGVPKLADFWSEELAKSEMTERVYVGDVMMQRVPIRRVALFPLRSGRLRVEGLTLQAAVMRRSRRGAFSIFEGEVADISFTSAPIDIIAKPLPPGPPVDAVGDLALNCAPPVQRNGGPVAIAVTLSGGGNLRAAPAPRFEGTVAGRLQIEGGDVTLSREDASFGMARRWRYLIFPASAGLLEIPPMSLRVFVPATGERRDLRCGSSFIRAIAAPPPQPSAVEAMEPPRGPARWPWLALFGVLFGALTIRPIGRELAVRRAVREIMRDASPAEIRARMQERVRIDLRESTDRGDAWRALLSLLDAAERERDIAADSDAEIRRRIAEVLRT